MFHPNLISPLDNDRIRINSGFTRDSERLKMTIMSMSMMPSLLAQVLLGKRRP
nr:hypothetical protein [Psychrobacter sp. PraFG1]UNK06217.1 hypothetical protein MN210_06435 [Psychrobacter sp. PraFG1]